MNSRAENLLPQHLLELLNHAADRIAERVIERIDDGFEQEKEPLPALLDRNRLARRLTISVETLDRLRRNKGFPTVWITDEAPRFELDRVLVFLRASGGAQ